MAWLRRYRRSIIATLAFGVMYFAAIEAWLPRIDPINRDLVAVMVLSSEVRKDGRLHENGASRLARGIVVARLSQAPLYISRIRRDKKPFLTSDSGQRLIVDAAGFVGLKVLDGEATNTRDEAERFHRVVPAGRIAIVTTRLHTRRACAAFENVGYLVTCVSSGPEVPGWKAPYFVAYESLALLKYRLKGWL